MLSFSSIAALHWTIKDDPDAPIAGALSAPSGSGEDSWVELGGHASRGRDYRRAGGLALERRGVKDAASRIPWYFPTARKAMK